MSEPDESPELRELTREEFRSLTLQGINPITLERKPSAAQIAERKEKETKHEFRVFLFLGVPAGFVVAMFIGLSANLGNAGFFCCWAVCSFVAGSVINSMAGMKKS